MKWRAGDRIWYEAMDGARFAGVIESVVDGWYETRLCDGFWAWKAGLDVVRLNVPEVDDGRIPAEHLHPRAGPFLAVDKE